MAVRTGRKEGDRRGEEDSFCKKTWEASGCCTCEGLFKKATCHFPTFVIVSHCTCPQHVGSGRGWNVLRIPLTPSFPPLSSRKMPCVVLFNFSGGHRPIKNLIQVTDPCSREYAATPSGRRVHSHHLRGSPRGHHTPPTPSPGVRTSCSHSGCFQYTCVFFLLVFHRSKP